MKVILSAFSCEPDLGSEDAVGWGWVIGLASKCEKLLVATRIESREGIERWLSRHPLDNVEFLYYIPKWHHFYKRLGRFRWIPNYLAWQKGIIPLLKTAAASEQYDVVHHVTVVSLRFRIRLGELGVPFVYGPIAGGDEAPIATWKGMTWRGKLGEALRFLSNRWLKYSPSIRKTLGQASKIISVSPQTTALIPAHLRGRVAEVLAISYDEPITPRKFSHRKSATLRMLFAARALDWKGLHLGLPAVARSIESGAQLHLTVVGNGPALAHWQALARKLGIDGRIDWLDTVPRSEFIRALPTYDLLFFPSLHDSGGLVVLEALASGVPVVCLDTGGPGQLVDSSCGIKVRIRSREQVIEDLATALGRLSRDEDLRLALSRNSVARVERHFTLDRKVDAVMRHYPG